MQILNSKFQKNLDNAVGRIAPSWPLKNLVAVNPYMGFTDTSFNKASEILAQRGNIRTTMPVGFYLENLKSGVITKEDLLKSFDKQTINLESFLKKAELLGQKKFELRNNQHSLTEIASDTDKQDWCELLTDRVSFWAAAHFDKSVSVWNKMHLVNDLYRSWKKEASADRTTEIMGLKGFRSSIKDLPEDHLEFLESFMSELNLGSDETEAYIHSVLLKIPGWSSYLSGLDFTGNLYESKTTHLQEFVAVLLSWENYFLKHSVNKENIKAIWYRNWYYGEPENRETIDELKITLILQRAFDLANQRILKTKFLKHKTHHSKSKPSAQAIFCIDVRSEAFRRNLEMVNPEIETIGFAGFFGFSIKYTPLGSENQLNLCPVLIPSKVAVSETSDQPESEEKKRVSQKRISRIWKSFRSGAITSFAFVSPLGLTFVPKILKDSFPTGIKRNFNKDTSFHAESKPILDLSGINLDEKVAMAVSALVGMGIKDNMSRLILLTGHGSTSKNNPHASGLDCGACGGHSGKLNALTAQYIFNDPLVRCELREKGIFIPDETLFVACLHNTTTDGVDVIDESLIPESHKEELEAIKKSFLEAGNLNRLERSSRLNLQYNPDSNKDILIMSRAKDWSQIRPEWGLAGCHSFIIAQRKHTKGLKLNGRSFLHSYHWKSDQDYKLLESIIMAPMMVTSWINLQYYASTTDTQKFGSGNKTLHNITSGIGVIEGSGGDLRIGLPLQSVHNGKSFEHLPIRLNVVIEAPISAINDILSKQDSIRQLFDNEWIFLHRMDEEGRISHTYTKNLQWENELKETMITMETVL